jgi:hypothetical protein
MCKTWQAKYGKVKKTWQDITELVQKRTTSLPPAKIPTLRGRYESIMEKGIKVISSKASEQQLKTIADLRRDILVCENR